MRVTIGANIKKVASGAFYNCLSIVEVYTRSTLSQSKFSMYGELVTFYTQPFTSKLEEDSQGCIMYEKGGEKYLVGYAGSGEEIVIPEGVTVIYSNIFSGCYLEKITVAASVREIRALAFGNISGLQEIAFAEDGTWMVNNTPIVLSELTAGEIFDYFTVVYAGNVWRRI